VDLPSVDGFVTAYLTAEHHAQIVVAALGFSLGSGYSVELVQITEEDGTPRVFGVRPSQGIGGGETLGFNPHLSTFNLALDLARRDIFFRFALRDYTNAIAEATDCATYCYRAIESLKAAFNLRTGIDGWQVMHDALGTDRATIEATVKIYADPVRHGNWVAARPTNSQNRWEMLLLTRNILTAYLERQQESNQSPEPVPAAVTPPAGQESRHA
jgi:hypothetical protein